MPRRAAATDLPFALPQVAPAARRRARDLLAALTDEYPDARCELVYRSPHELLVATILSAQTTDAGVNRATPALFARFPTPADYAAATPEEIEPFVRSLGFFRAKSRAIHSAMTDVAQRFAGEVPRTMDELLTLRGVARKTASVVLGNAFDINVGIPVDTHVQRLAARFALVEPGTTVAMIERTLMALFPRDQWSQAGHVMIWHGRRVCKARGAACRDHPICRRFGVACELARTTKKPGRKKAKSQPAKSQPGKSRTAGSKTGGSKSGGSKSGGSRPTPRRA